MFKKTSIVWPLILCLVTAGCDSSNTAVSNALLPGTDGLKSVSVSSMPQGYDYSFSEKNAAKLVNFILRMDVVPDFPEDPNVYTGMTWVIAVEYEDGSTVTVYLFGNMFIRSGENPWQKVSAKEAEELKALLDYLS